MNFKNWLKNNLTVVPKKELSEKIMNLAEKNLSKEAITNENKGDYFWKLSMSMAMIAIVFSMTFNKKINHENTSFIAESQELILNYQDMELMADASTLSDDDWKKIQ
jgi:hypothetical protein